MTDAKADKKIEIAARLGFLSDNQIQIIQQKKAESNHPDLEIAIRNGYLNRSQLDLINICLNPLDVVPGYQIDGLIGQGGVGVVFKATQLRMDRAVAIKSINQSSIANQTTIKRFEREAQIVGNLRHPNIVSAYDFGLHNAKLYLVMEFVEGIDGEKYLSEKVRLPESHAWHVALQVCHALDYANQNGIIHRDIKPGNLILTQPPSGSQLPPRVPFIKIADFGLARFKDNPSSATITIDSGISGTPYYMSPEQVKGQDIDHHSDIYALGVTLWHLIAGHPPIDGSSPLDVVTAKMKLEDDWMSKTPTEISPAGFELLKKMCRFDRGERTSDYTSLVEGIESVIETLKDEDLNSPSNIENSNEKFSATTSVTFVGEFDEFKLCPNGKSSAANTDSSNIELTQDFKPSDTKALRSNRTRVLAPSLILLMACLAGLYMFWPKPTPGSPQTIDRETIKDNTPLAIAGDAPKRLQEPNGLPVLLFDGFRVDPRGQGPGSKWENTKGVEGGNVLAGTGSKRFKCVDQDREPLDYFRFSCGFRHHESEQVEFVWLDSTKAPIFKIVAKLDAAQVFLGDKESDRCDLPELDQDSFGYHQIQIESQPGYWRVAIGTEFIKNVPKPSGADSDATIELNVSGAGSAHFEGPRFVPFKS